MSDKFEASSGRAGKKFEPSQLSGSAQASTAQASSSRKVTSRKVPPDPRADTLKQIASLKQLFSVLETHVANTQEPLPRWVGEKINRIATVEANLVAAYLMSIDRRTK